MRTRLGGIGRSERGSVLVSGLLLTLAVLMILGAAVDLGHAFIVRRDLTAIADDAALAGAQHLDLTAIHHGRLALDPNEAQAAALSALAPDHELSAQAGATDTLVHVRVSRTFPTVLLRLVGLNELTVSADANATPRAP
jgi:Flp pilus assembly protein TadG